MIKNDKQLAIVRAQLARAEAALEVIRQEVRPQNENMYRLMAESYIEVVLSHRVEIDAYMGIETIPETAAIVIALEGDRVGLGHTSAGAVTRLVDTFRRGIQSTVEILGSITRPDTSRRRARWIEEACDLPFVGVAPGSLRVLLGEPESGTLFSEEERRAFDESLDTLFDAIEWADVKLTPEGQQPQLLEDKKKRQALLAVVTRLLPPRSGEIERVSFQRRTATSDGRVVRKATLTRKSRDRIKQEMAALADDVTYQELEGVIRSVDLDTQTFALRERPDQQQDLPCDYGADLEEAVKEYLDQRVIVSGLLEVNKKTQKVKMSADNIELIAPEESGSNSPSDNQQH